jgi:transposase
MNSADYQDILVEHLMPNAVLITDGDYTFMQDNASIHASASTQSFLEVNKIKILNWPSKSPDLNPIENLWGWLTRKVYAHGKQFKHDNDLKSAVGMSGLMYLQSY